MKLNLRHFVVFSLAVIAVAVAATFAIDPAFAHAAFVSDHVTYTATLGSTVLTYSDWSKRLDANGKVDKVVEILDQTNEALADMLVMEANNGTTHKTTVRTGIPEAAWRLLNYGVPNVKSRTAQITDTSGMLEAYAEIDKALADLNGNTNAFRLSEAKAIMEGMNQQMAQTLFYGNTRTNPERFLGLTPRYASLDPTVALSAENVIDGGGTGSDNTSIWFIGWSANTVHGFFPKGSKAGLSQNNLGEQTLFDDNGGKYQGYRDHFKWDLGLSLRDWRYCSRICNVDVSAITTDPDAMKALIGFMIDAEEHIPNTAGRYSSNEGEETGNMTFAWYMNKQVRAALRKGILEKIANNLTEEKVAGKRVTMFDGFPVRRVDALSNLETRVTPP